MRSFPKVFYGDADSWNSYSVPVSCSNCGGHGYLAIKRGTRVPSTSVLPPCPPCGCKTLRVDR